MQTDKKNRSNKKETAIGRHKDLDRQSNIDNETVQERNKKWGNWEEVSRR